MTCTDCATPIDDRSPLCGPCLESHERQSQPEEPEKTIEQLITEMMDRKRQRRLQAYEEAR